MKTDRYTRIVLTVIAACLLWLCAKDTAPTTYAQQIDAGERVLKVQIVSVDKAFGLKMEPLPVKVITE